MIKIIPAILTNDPSQANELIESAQGVVSRIQVDVVDGVFVDNKTLEPTYFSDFDLSLDLDYHLMVREPINWVEKCVTGQADRIIGQVEQMEDQFEFIKKVQSVGLLVGLALDLETPAAVLSDEVLQSLDVVLLLSVKAGFAGQEFNLSVWEKIKQLVEKRNKLDHKFRICVDGGVTVELARDLGKAGVDEVAVGKRIFEGGLKQNLELFNN